MCFRRAAVRASFHRWELTTFSKGRRLFTPKKGRSAFWRRRLLSSRDSKASTITRGQSRRGSNKRREHGTDGKNRAKNEGDGDQRRPGSRRQGSSRQDRKSTRLNSSHLGISYAV